jgi:hypothetical protein
VNAGAPVTSPIAYTPGAEVASRSSTTTKPRASRAIPRGLGADVVGVRAAAGGDQQVRAPDERAAARGPVAQLGLHAVPRAGGDAHDLVAEAQVDAVLAEDRGQRLAHVGVLARQQTVVRVDHGDGAAEPAVELRELQPDVAAAEDEQVRR